MSLSKGSPLVFPTLASLAILALGAFAFSSATPNASAEPVTYRVDSGHSIVLFKIRHMDVANFYGTFDKLSGEITFDEDKPANCSVKVEVESASIDSNSKDRDDLLKSAPFFDSETHPTWTFESTSVKKGKKGALVLLGDLTMKGVKKEVQVDLEVISAGSKDRAGFEARFKLDRNDYGISGTPVGLGAEVEVIVALEGAKPRR